MPVYNAERDLRESIDSILAQTYRDFEFIIIDDGSTDGSRRVIESYRDDRILVAANENNKGLARTLNRGLEMARGEFVARQDADDVSLPERLAKQVDFLDRRPDIGVLGTWYRKIDEQGGELGFREPPCDPLEIRWRLLLDVPIVHSTILMRRSFVIEKAGLYNGEIRYAEDYEYWLRMVRDVQFANLDEYLVKVRISASSMTGRERVAEHIAEIRRGNLLRVYAETHDGTDVRALDLDVMNKLLVGPRYGLEKVDTGKVEQGAKNLVHLHEVFCKYHLLDAAVAKHHRDRVFGEISRRLIDLAHMHFYGDYDGARRMSVLASRLHPSIVFSESYLRLVAKLLVRPRFVQAIRSLAKTAHT